MSMIDVAWWALQKVTGFRYYGGTSGAGINPTRTHYLAKRLPLGFGAYVKFTTTHRGHDQTLHWTWRLRVGRYKTLVKDMEHGQ